MNTQPLFSRLCHSLIFRCAAVLLVALAWSSLAFCGEIHDAAKSGDLAKVEALLKENPDLVSSKDSNGYTPLHYAASEGHRDVAELLLAHGADVNAKNNEGVMPLHDAAYEGHKDVAELLLANKAEVNAKDSVGWTPLHWAANGGLKAVWAPSSQNEIAKTGMIATPAVVLKSGQLDVVELLLARGITVGPRGRCQCQGQLRPHPFARGGEIRQQKRGGIAAPARRARINYGSQATALGNQSEQP